MVSNHGCCETITRMSVGGPLLQGLFSCGQFEITANAFIFACRLTWSPGLDPPSTKTLSFGFNVVCQSIDINQGNKAQVKKETPIIYPGRSVKVLFWPYSARMPASSIEGGRLRISTARPMTLSSIIYVLVDSVLCPQNFNFRVFLNDMTWGGSGIQSQP